MTADGRKILADYCRFGWALVPIPLGRKGPVGGGWNKRELCITEPDVAEFIDGNIGLAHAYSGTCAIDVDDITLAREWLAVRGVDLDALLASPSAVRIESRPGRAKLIYRIPKPLPSFNLGGLELRCGTSTGTTVQDVLPPSIHPDTNKPYTWRYGSAVTSWTQLSFIPDALHSLWLTLIPAAAPKPPRPTKAMRAKLPELAQLLDAHDPDASYPDWLKVGMALHHEVEGRPEGLALWNEWSASGKKYKGIGDLEVHWRSFRIDHDNPVTLASLRTESPADASEFPDVPEEGPSAPVVAAPASGAPRAPMGRTPLDKPNGLEALRAVKRNGNGIIEARISNVVAVLGVPQVSGHDLALDEFQDAILVGDPDVPDAWRLLNDSDYVNLRVWLETAGNCDPIPHEMMRQGVLLVAERNRVDTAQQWLTSLQWDGTPRVERFCHTYFGTGDGPYERAVGKYLWTALAGRIMAPGCQADMVPVLIGKQGVGKSTGVQALTPAPEHYVELRLDEPDDAIARKCRGVLVAELAEMRGLRAAEVERVKAFVTRKFEKWVPKYREFATNYPRRFLIIGTTNDEEFLPVDTEHRRWLPLHTSGVDVPAIKRDRDQLWAEALLLYSLDGVHWQGVDNLAKPARDAASGEDGWQEEIAAWVCDFLSSRDARHQWFRMHDVLTQAVGLDSRSYNRSHELRAARILRELGYERTTEREAGRVVKVWSRVIA